MRSTPKRFKSTLADWNHEQRRALASPGIVSE
jgi:hypothetical protein